MGKPDIQDYRRWDGIRTYVLTVSVEVFHGDDCEECRLLGCYAVSLL
jgi:hypothetical protein